MSAPIMAAKPILLVEDCDDDALIFKRILKKVKLENPVHCVSCVDDAISYLEGQGQYDDRIQYPFPSIIFIDLKLPEKDGFQLLEWLSRQPVMRNMLLVVLSGGDGVGDVTKAYDMGAKSFLRKPIKPGDFENLVKEIQICGETDSDISHTEATV